MKRYLFCEPNAILFVYGPKSSGKSTLMIKVARRIKGEPFSFLWYDLRGYAVEKLDDTISILLRTKGFPKTFLRLEAMNIFGKGSDPFVVMEENLLELRERKRSGDSVR